MKGYIDWPLTIIAMVAIALVLGLIWAIADSSRDSDRLMAQCMADGKKEYECVAMLRNNSSTIIPMPIYIPSGR